MPIIRYRVSDESGSIRVLALEAEDEMDACSRVEAKGLIPLELVSSNGDRTFGVFRRSAFSCEEFTDQLVPLLDAGVSLERAIDFLADASDKPEEERMLRELHQGLHEGRRLSEMTENRPRLFSAVYTGLVRAGEESGSLCEVMKELRTHMAMKRETRNFIVSTLIYPAFVLFVCAGVLAILLGTVVPRFGGVILRSGRATNFGTQVLLTASEYFRQWWWVIPILLLAVIILIPIISGKDSFRRMLDSWCLKIPVVRQMVVLSSLATFARTLAILLKNGVPIMRAVEISRNVVASQGISESLESINPELRKGAKLSAALSKSRYVPSMMLRLLAVGEETGDTESVLLQLAEKYSTEFRTRVKRLLSLFEPIVIIVLGLIVGAIVLSLFMAVLDMQRGV